MNRWICSDIIVLISEGIGTGRSIEVRRSDFIIYLLLFISVISKIDFFGRV
ncbi:MAG: hypothetical protein ACTSRP_16120 [Candidatus Helarchaeota archaeon]